MKKRISIPIAVILCMLILVPANFSALATPTSKDNQATNGPSNGHDNNGKAIGNPHNKSVWCTLYNEDLGEISEGALLAYLHFCVKGVSSHRSENPHPPPKVPIPSPVSYDTSSTNIIPVFFDIFSNIIPKAFGTSGTQNIIQVNNDPVAPNGTKRTQSESSIAVSGNNIVVGYNDNQDPNTSTYSGYSYSNDGGKTWTDGGGILPNPGDFDANDPSVAADSSGNFYFSMLVENATFTKVGVAKSTDGGKTFGNPVIVDSINASATPAFLDKDYMAVGKNPSNPSQDIIHITYTRFTTSAAEIVYHRSLDGGKTWQDTCTLNPGGDATGAMPVVDPTGKTVYVFYQDFLTGKVVGWKNTNAGAGCNWTRVTDVGVFHSLTVHEVCGGDFGVWNGNHRATDIPVEAVGPNGNIYVTWNDSPDGGKTTQIILYRSQDGGNTWTGPQTFSPTPGRDQFEPWIAVAPNGKITMIFYDRVNDPNNLSLDLYAATSTDNGTTWQPNQRITPSSSYWGTLDPPSDPYFFSCYFVGDYQGMAFGSNNVANIVWTDGHVVASDGTPDPNVYYTQLVSATVSSAPTGLAATAGNAQALISWSTPSNNGGAAITGYKIYRSTSSGTESFLTAVGNVTSYTDTGLTNGITYYYKVTAVNSVGESVPSNEASAVPVTVPQPPTSLATTTGSSSQINLSWTAPTDNGGAAITGYNVYRGTTPGGEGSTPIATGITSTSYTDTGLTNGQTYYYKVTAVNSVGESVPSNEASATTFTVPQPPTGLSATAGVLQIHLNWNAPTNDGGSAIIGYKIERSIDGGSTWSTIVSNTGSTGTTYTDTHVLPLTAYTYRVSAINAIGTSNPSNVSSATTPLGVL